MSSVPPASPGSRAADQSVRHRTPLILWVPWLLLLVVALFGAGLGMLYVTVRAENAVLREQQRLLEAELRGSQQRAEAERILIQHELAELRRKSTEP